MQPKEAQLFTMVPTNLAQLFSILRRQNFLIVIGEFFPSHNKRRSLHRLNWNQNQYAEDIPYRVHFLLAANVGKRKQRVKVLEPLFL